MWCRSVVRIYPGKKTYLGTVRQSMGNDDAEELESLGLDVAGGSLDTRRGPRFGCTPAMEAWVEHVLDGCTDGEAARLAGYAGKDEKAFAIRGSKLRHHSRVKVLLETRKLERAGIVSPKILSAERGLELLSKIAEEGKNEQARISAVKALRDIEREASAPTLNRAGFDKLVADGWLRSEEHKSELQSL